MADYRAMTERAGRIIKNSMHKDKMDVFRGEGLGVLMYPNLPCHFIFKSTPNTNPATIDTFPVIHSIDVHMDIGFDVRNADYLVVKRINSEGKMTVFYQGRCGEPLGHIMEIKKSEMQISTKGGIIPEPPVPPAEEISTVIIDFLDENQNSISPRLISNIPKYEFYSLYSPSIDGYGFMYSVLDGRRLRGKISTQIRNPINDEYHIELFYAALGVATSFRVLVNSLYTKDDGMPAFGLHLYAPFGIINIVNNEMTISIDRFIHAETLDIIRIQKGTKIRLEPIENWKQVVSVTSTPEGNFSVILEDTSEPSPPPYVTGRY